VTLSWNNRLGQVHGLPKLIPGHLYRARWIASVPCIAIPQTGSDPFVVALRQLGFDVLFATTDSNKLYGRSPPWPDSRKGPPDEAGPLNCAVYTEQRWAGAELFFIPDVLASVPGLRVWDLWDEDADPVDRDLIRAGQPTHPLPLPPVPPIVPPTLPEQPPVTTPPQQPAKKPSLAWLWVPVIGVTGLIFVGTLRPAR
jgi:hypothetical protein